HLVADRRGVRTAHHVDDGAVLHVAAAPDPDAVHVAADHHVHPDAARLAQLDIADDLCAGIHIGRGVHPRMHPLVAAEHPVIIHGGRPKAVIPGSTEVAESAYRAPNTVMS